MSPFLSMSSDRCHPTIRSKFRPKHHRLSCRTFHLRSALSTSSPLFLFSFYYLHCRIHDICCYSNDVSVLSVLRPLLSHFLISFSLLMATSIRSPLLCYLTSQFWSRRLHQLFSDIFGIFFFWEETLTFYHGPHRQDPWCFLRLRHCARFRSVGHGSRRRISLKVFS